MSEFIIQYGAGILITALALVSLSTLVVLFFCCWVMEEITKNSDKWD